MIKILDKLFTTETNYSHVKNSIKKLSSKSSIYKIFEAINSFSKDSEVRFVGGVIRKIISKETIDDIDFSTNLSPNEVCSALKHNKIKYYETGISHGTITAIIDDEKFEITSLRKDISTDGRHALVEFSKNWKDDAKRRDFTINSIYADREGNLFDPFDGISDLNKGNIRFIGDADKRIKEDYLRILRYIRFYLDYSKNKHDSEIIRKIKINIGGVHRLSKERLYDELKKMLRFDSIEKLSKDKISQELVAIIFPELRYLNIFSKLNSYQKNILKNIDFPFLLSLMIVDETDNTDYFFYRFKISKKDQNRIKIIDKFFKEKINSNTFKEKNLNKFFYYNGRQSIIDILSFKIIRSKKFDRNLMDLIKIYENKILPIMPIKADEIMSKYKILQGKHLGLKLRQIEEEWVNNDFNITEQQVDNIVKN